MNICFSFSRIYFTFAQKVNLDIYFRFTLKIDLKSRHYLPVKKQTRADVIEKSICLKSIENILEKWRKFTRGPSTTPLWQRNIIFFFFKFITDRLDSY